MAEGHESSRAAWTAVVIMIVGFTVAGMGVVLLNWWVFGAGFGIVVLGAIVGKAMSAMGMGQTASYRQPEAEERTDGQQVRDTPPGT